jgi:subtilisin family serine protease
LQLSLSALGSLSGRGVRIAIIDSGVHAANPHVQFVAGGVGIDASGRTHDDFVDRLGHGTAVTAVIREKAPEAELRIIKIFDRELATTGDALVTALRYARAERVNLVNLSLGTNNPEHEAALASEIAAGFAAGLVIVAAAPQQGVRWLPGDLPGVIAVELDNRLARDACDVSIDGSAVTMKTCGFPRPIPGVAPERNLQGISFAVANATGFLARVLEATRPGESLAETLARVAAAP